MRIIITDFDFPVDSETEDNESKIKKQSSQDIFSQESTSHAHSDELSQEGTSQETISLETNSEKLEEASQTNDDNCIEKIEHFDDDKKESDEVGKPEFETAPNVSVDEPEDHTQVYT